MSKPFYDYILKFIVVGDSSVGKSNLLLQFTDKRFQPTHDLTIGVEFGTKLISHNKTVYKAQIWDTAGQEVFKSITRSYYKGSIGCLLVYDITQRHTFTAVSEWLKEIRQSCSENMIIVLIGNKTDVDSRRQVSADEGREFAKENAISFFETSAKTGFNVHESFLHIIDNIGTKITEGTIDLTIPKAGIQVSDAAFGYPELNESNKGCLC